MAIGFAAGAAHAGTFAALTKLQARGARVSAMAVNLGSGAILGQLNPQKRLTPASISKLYTAAAALERWGPAHRFTTRILRTGTIRNGVLHGNLIFMGAGDPTLDERDLWLLAQEVRDEGITKVAGHLVINDSLFGSIHCRTADRCDAKSASGHAYNAPLSAAGTDFATWCVEIRPGKHRGSRGDIGWCRVPVPVALEGEVTTIAANRPAKVSVLRRTRAGQDHLIVSGSIPLQGKPVRLYRAVSDADEQTALLLRSTLRNMGVRIRGTSVISHRPPPVHAQAVATVHGQSLREQLARMLAYSNNYMADMLALDLVADGSPGTPVTLSSAGERLQHLAKVAIRAENDDISTGNGKPVFRSGSGLTVGNALSSADMLALLSYMYHRSELFPAFVGALSVPRYSPLQMLSHGDNAWLNRLSVKTGSLNEPYSVMSLAGYYRTRDGGWGAFSFIVNGSRRWPHIPYSVALAAMRQDMKVLLASH